MLDLAVATTNLPAQLLAVGQLAVEHGAEFVALDLAVKWAKDLDKPSEGRSSGFFTYPVRYADAVKVDARGTIWLTDASRRFGAKAVGSTFEASVLDILEHSCSGRLIAFDPTLGVARVALQGLCFPNGLAFSPDGGRLLARGERGLRFQRVLQSEKTLIWKATHHRELPDHRHELVRRGGGEDRRLGMGVDVGGASSA